MTGIRNKPGGRPAKSRIDKQNRVVSTKLTELQFYAIRKRATEAGLHVSEYVRQAVVSAEVTPRLNRQDAGFPFLFFQSSDNWFMISTILFLSFTSSTATSAKPPAFARCASWLMLLASPAGSQHETDRVAVLCHQEASRGSRVACQ